jgi:hypothetical protein
MRRPLFLCAVGAVLLSLVLPGACGTADRVLLAAAAACALLAALFGAEARESALPAQLAFGAAFPHGLYWLAFEQPWGQVSLQGLSLLALVIGAAYLCVHLRASLQKARFWILIVLFAVMAAAVLLRAQAHPRWSVFAAALACAVVTAELGGFTGELAALALLYQGGPFLILERSLQISLAVVVVLSVAAAARLRPAARIALARAAAGGAAVWLAAALLAGLGCEAAWPACAVLCAAAALFAKGESSRVGAGLDK